MRRLMLALLAIVCCAAVGGVATPASAENYGLNDSHGVWRDAEYWHSNHPDWVYRYHPEWVAEREEWWSVDHRAHPEWFGSPYWRRYPVWTYGEYDRGHVWRSARWWHERDPGWFYAHHPQWAEPYPGWVRRDHGGHPEWFRGNYWHEHPRDWNHPDEEYRRNLSRNVEYQQAHQGMAKSSANSKYGESNHGAGAATHVNGAYHAGAANGVDHRSASAGQYHAPSSSAHTYHASTSNGSSSFSHSSSGGSHSGGGGGHKK